MSQYRLFTIDTDGPVYFCDPHSPWQRGSNENTVSVVPGPLGLVGKAEVGSSGTLEPAESSTCITAGSFFCDC